MPSLLTLPDLFAQRIAQSPAGEAYREYDRAAGRWRSLDWAAVGREAARWRRALAGEGLAPGDRVAVLARGCVAHVCMDQAVLARGCVPVPLHAIDNPESIAYILADSGARLLLVEAAQRWNPLAQMRDRFPALKKVLSLDRPEMGDAVWTED